MGIQVWQNRTWILVGAGLGLLIIAGVLLLSGTEVLSRLGLGLNDDDVAPRVNAHAPDFALVSLSGEKVSLASLRGEPVVVNFWATWCAPCVEEMPGIQKYYENFPNAFEVLAVNADEPEADVRQFVSDMGLTFPVLLDPEGKTQELYRLRGYPTTFFVDAEGIIRYEHIGQLHGDQLKEYLKGLGIGE